MLAGGLAVPLSELAIWRVLIPREVCTLSNTLPTTKPFAESAQSESLAFPSNTLLLIPSITSENAKRVRPIYLVCSIPYLPPIYHQ